MGFRFSKRIQILPGVRINFSKGGASLSVGPRGASVSLGKRGVYGNVGVPGTGLSWRERLDQPSGGSSSASGASRGRSALCMPETVTVRLVDDTVHFFNQDNGPLDASLLSTAKAAMKDEIQTFLKDRETARNDVIDSLRRLHHDIPVTTQTLRSSDMGKPKREQYPSQEAFMEALMTWNAARANGEVGADELADGLLQTLGDLQWPAETNIAISFHKGRLLLDVDLPEIEDMPTTRWKAVMTRLSLEEKPVSQKEVAGFYFDHVCSIIVRLIGHAMATSDAIRSVAVSAYTQRNTATGHVDDEYVAIVEVSRSAWDGIDRSQMASIDPHNLLRHFGAKIQANARGVLLVQTPLS
ncbi:DUF4236 domain-containing protein [Sphingomonas olei]